jgi:hypothetical protein
MKDPSQPIPVKKLLGRVAKVRLGKGSKSERDAVVLETEDGRYVLRRKTGPAFGDVELDRYLGHQVSCDGYLVETTLLAERIRVVG